MLSNEELRAIDSSPYKPWTKSQKRAHDAAEANGWTAESSNPTTVTYRRGSDYVQIQVAYGLTDLDTGRPTGNGRIVHASAPRRYFTTWATVSDYVDRKKGQRRPR